MHRSGTSVVARGLAALGVDLGDRFLPANEENATGFWEDVEVVSLNDRILAALGASWESVAELDVGRLSPAEASRFEEEARAIIGSRFTGQLWGFKDPRTARLLPFWQSVLEQLHITPAYVIVTRHPSCVARSLVGRGISRPHACLLWLQHNHSAVAATAGASRVFVDYDRLLASPVAELRRVGRALGLPLTTAVERDLCDYERDFIDPSLRHNVVSAAESEPIGLCALASRAYEVLCRIQDAGHEDSAATAAWQSFGTPIDAVVPLADWTDALIGDRRRIMAAHRALVREHAGQKARADALERQVSRLESQYSVLAGAVPRQGLSGAGSRRGRPAGPGASRRDPPLLLLADHGAPAVRTARAAAGLSVAAGAAIERGARHLAAARRVLLRAGIRPVQLEDEVACRPSSTFLMPCGSPAA